LRWNGKGAADRLKWPKAIMRDGMTVLKFINMSKVKYIVGLPALSIVASVLFNIDKFQVSFLKGGVHTIFLSLLIYGLFSVSRKYLFLRIFAAIFIVSDLFVGLAYGSSLNISVIMSFMESSWSESLAFIKFNIWYLLVSAFMLLGLVQARPFFVKSVNNSALIIGLCYLFLPTVASAISDSSSHGINLQKKIAKAKGQSEVIAKSEHYLNEASYRFRPLKSIIGISDVIAFMYIKADKEHEWRDVEVGASSPSLMVVVIGESQRPKNMSLYGYPRKTTPKLDEISDSLQVYQHAYAAGPNTWTAVPAMLTKQSGEKSIAKSIINLANQAGYSTHWYSNQAKYSRWDYSVSSIAEQANEVYFASDISAGAVLDGVLITKLKREIERIPEGEKHLFVLNLYGSHMDFKDRYPDEFSVFKGESTMLDEYDNSILYLDTLLTNVISATKRKNGQFMYLADHGLGSPDGEMAFRHDMREQPDMDSLQIPFFTFKNSNLRMGAERVLSMYYFECIFSEWAGITASDLRDNNYCEKSLNNDSQIVYLDLKLKKNTRRIIAQ